MRGSNLLARLPPTKSATSAIRSDRCALDCVNAGLRVNERAKTEAFCVIISSRLRNEGVGMGKSYGDGHRLTVIVHPPKGSQH